MSIHSLNKVIGQQLKMGMYWEYETYWAPIKDKATGKQIMVPMKKRVGPFYHNIFTWTGSFWCPQNRFEKWAVTPRLERANEQYADRPTHFVDRIYGTQSSKK